MNNNPSIVFGVALLSLCANNSIEPAKWNKSTCFIQTKYISTLIAHYNPNIRQDVSMEDKQFTPEDIARIQQSREQIARGDYMVVDPNNVWGSIL
jgi:hypothetical protein